MPGGVTSVQSFVKISEMVQKLKSDTQHSDLVTLHIFFFRLESRLKMAEVESTFPFCMSLKYIESGGVAALVHNSGIRWK